MSNKLPDPWRAFFAALDRELTTGVELHCLGGFITTVCYGAPRKTFDVDVLPVLPRIAADVYFRSRASDRRFTRPLAYTSMS